MTGLEIVLLAGAGYLLYSYFKGQRTDQALELGGGLSDTDIEGYQASLTRAHPVVKAKQSTKPSGMAGDQMLQVESRKQIGPVGIVYTSGTGEPRTVPEGQHATGGVVG